VCCVNRYCLLRACYYKFVHTSRPRAPKPASGVRRTPNRERFVLHTHSWYSLLEGVSSPEALAARARHCGYDALALTDTNNLYGAVPFVEAARRRGITPILGACLRQQRSRCVALIAEPAGWRSLCHVLTALHLDDARLADLLCNNAAGLHVLADDLVLAERLREAFGRRLWLEVVRPGPGNRDRRSNERREAELLEGGRRLGLLPVASCAAHFATPQEHEIFRLATTVRQGGLLDQMPSVLSITPDHHLIDGPTLRARFRDLPEALHNLKELTGQLPGDVLPGRTILPPAKVPRDLDAQRFLRRLCERGMQRRLLYRDPAAHERLGEELAIIDAGSLASYFLVVRDIARHARHARLAMALRGSAGNSLVCYLLGITDVNPLRFGLALDRFLHIGRPDLPDIDLDFDWRVRDTIIEHVFERYGKEHTAMVSSHLFLQPRSAFREAGKIHGLSNEQITLLAQTIEAGDHEEDPRDAQLDVAMPVPQHFPLEPARWPRLLRDAQLLLGRPHHLSVHPGGVVITPGPITDHAPVQMAAKGVRILQFEKDAVEATGLVKIDLLGNRALSNVDETMLRLAAVATPHPDPPPQGGREEEGPGLSAVNGERLSPSPLAGEGRGGGSQQRPNAIAPVEETHDDPAVLRILQTGDTLGVNQLESPAMRHLLIQLHPQGIEDVICALALIRPGAGAVGMKGKYIDRRCGGEPVPPMPACLEPVLRDTYGLLVYQDDALGMVRALTGLSVPDTHRFYKRATRRVPEEEDRKLAEEFRALCLPRGIPEAVIAEQWQLLTHFRRYTFCKSHAVSYALIAWRCVHAKAHHPGYFWTAVLNNNQGVYPRRVYVEAVKRAGGRVLLPCVNRSEETFAPEGEPGASAPGGEPLLEKGLSPGADAPGSPGFCIRSGLGAIATLPEEVTQRILAERTRHGPYRDLADFRRRTETPPEALATLIRAGALDFTGQNRPALFLEADLQDHAAGWQDALFDDIGTLPWVPADYALDRRRRDEWQLLGFVADVPMLSLFRPRLPANLVRSVDFPRHRGRRVRTAGLVATGRFAHTERGVEMQFITLEDEWGLMEVTVFPGTCRLVTHLTLGPYLATGVVEEQFGVFTMTAESLELIGGAVGGDLP
jgi:DNA-directed DNA polymerase III PolC